MLIKLEQARLDRELRSLTDLSRLGRLSEADKQRYVRLLQEKARADQAARNA